MQFEIEIRNYLGFPCSVHLQQLLVVGGNAESDFEMRWAFYDPK